MRILLPVFLFTGLYCFTTNAASAPFIKNNKFKDTLPQNDSITGIFDDFSCHIGQLPSIIFTNHSHSLANAMKDSLSSVALKLKNYPECLLIIFYYYPGETMRKKFLSLKRINAIVTCIVENNKIDKERIVFGIGENGNSNIFDLQAQSR